MRGLCHVLWLIPTLSPSVSHSEFADLHCWLFPVQRCRSDPEWLAGTPRVLLGQPAADRCWEEAREAWINCRNAGLEAVDFALAPNVSLEKALAMCGVGRGRRYACLRRVSAAPLMYHLISTKCAELFIIPCCVHGPGSKLVMQQFQTSARWHTQALSSETR